MELTPVGRPPSLSPLACLIVYFQLINNIYRIQLIYQLIYVASLLDASNLTSPSSLSLLLSPPDVVVPRLKFLY